MALFWELPALPRDHMESVKQGQVASLAFHVSSDQTNIKTGAETDGLALEAGGAGGPKQLIFIKYKHSPVYCTPVPPDPQQQGPLTAGSLNQLAVATGCS